MLKNANRVLKNTQSGGTTNIFKSQVVESYIENNTYYNNSVTIGISGLSTSAPLKVAYQTPTGVIRNSYTTNGINQPTYAGTSETSYKKYFFYNNILKLYSLEFNQNYGGYYYRGDLIKLTEQFPILNKLVIPESIFNKNLTNTTLPSTLRTLSLSDSTLSGDISKIKNFGNIEDITLTNVLFTNNLTNLSGTNLKKIQFSGLLNLKGNLNDLISNNPNFYHLYLWNCVQWSGNSSTLDISKLKYIYVYAANNIGFTGNFSGWTFNTGLTTFILYTRNVFGNISNWNITNTKISQFSINNYYYTTSLMRGGLSGWTMPTTLNSFQLYGVTGLTSTPLDFSNCTNFTTFTISYAQGLSQDLNLINFGNKLTTLQIDTTSMSTNLETWTMPTGVTQLNLRNSKFTGNLSGITLNNKVTSLQLENNKLTGNPVNMTIPNTLTALYLSNNTGITFNLNAGSFNTNKLTTLYLDGIGSISGNFSNLPIPNNNTNLRMHNTTVTSDLTNLNPTKLYYFYAYNCKFNCNVTNWLTGTTSLYYLQLNTNPNLSGDTTNWNVNGIYDLNLQGTKLSGALKHNNVRTINLGTTNISSNIRTDFNFSNRAYQVQLYAMPNLTGSLSGVTLNYGIYYFGIYGSGNVTGSNHFVNYIFTNRSYWTYSSPTFYFQSIGDTVTGATENLGDLGTYPTGSTGYQWNLTEEQVNNLVAGTDYNGSGTNVKWNSKQKIYWMKNAKISSTNLNRRYVNFQIQYS